MSNPYIGEIRMFGGNFAPQGWALCDGSLLPISEYTTLFTLIGTTYGGDGINTFALPNLQGRIPIHQGSGAGATYLLGESGGVEAVTLITQTMPQHTHPVAAHASGGSQNDPTSGVWAGASRNIYASLSGAPANMNAGGIGIEGQNQPHDNLSPYLCVTFIISLFGIFPSQT